MDELGLQQFVLVQVQGIFQPLFSRDFDRLKQIINAEVYAFLAGLDEFLLVAGGFGPCGHDAFRLPGEVCSQCSQIYLAPFGQRSIEGRKDGGVTTIHAPGVRYTIPFGLNNRGQIVGIAASDLPLVGGVTAYGFLLAKGAKGPFTRIEFPGALRTLATDINDRGQIVGIHTNPDAMPDRQPSPMPRPMMMSGSDG